MADYSTNYYLSINKLEGKEDMPINHMFKIYEDAQTLKNIPKYGILDNEVNKERAEIEKHKRDLQRQLQDMHFDLEKQRSELTNEFDQVIKKREHEWRLQSEDFNSNILAKELEVNLV